MGKIKKFKGGFDLFVTEDEKLLVTSNSRNQVYVYDLEASKVGASYLFGNMVLTDDKEPTADPVSEHTEIACGYCGKVHGTSFKEVLIKFFHRIFYFFVKLFGLKK